MADVSIDITAETGDTTAKIAALRMELDELGHSGESAGETIGGNNQKSLSSRLDEFSNAMDDATRASHRAGSDIMRFDQLGQDAEEMLSGGGAGGGGLVAGLSDAAGSFGSFLGSLTPVLAPLGIVAGLIFAVYSAVVALTDVLGTLIGFLGDLVAPIAIVTGLLGGLAAAFVVGAEKAIAGKGPFKDFGDTVQHLQDMFSKTATELGERFLPYLDQLAGAAEKALKFIDKLAHEPLAEAFHDMATKGVQMLTQFLEQVGHVLAKPIRLAFQIAFGTGPGGNEASSAISSIWNQLQNFFLGYTVRHPIELRPGVFKIQTTTVDGVFQPFLDWFNRHNFSKQGFEIGADIRKGFTSSGAAKDLGTLLDNALIDGMKHALAGMGSLWIEDQTFWLGQFQKLGFGLANAITHAAETAFSWIRNHWQAIVSYIENPLQISLNWPNVPGDIMAVINFFGGGSGPRNTPPPRGAPGGHIMAVAGASSGGGLGGIHIHFHGEMSGMGSHAAARRHANLVGQEIARNWRQRAGG